MTGNNPDDNPDQGTSDQIQTATLEDILDLKEGDAIAIRAIIGECVEIFAGRVDADSPSMASIENALDESCWVSLLPVDTNLWWRLKDDQIDDRSHELDELPPYQKALGEPLTDPPLCSLDYREEDGVLFTVPSPVYGGGSVHHYARDEHRPVVALESGDIVKPTELIPDNRN